MPAEVVEVCLIIQSTDEFSAHEKSSSDPESMKGGVLWWQSG